MAEYAISQVTFPPPVIDIHGLHFIKVQIVCRYLSQQLKNLAACEALPQKEPKRNVLPQGRS